MTYEDGYRAGYQAARVLMPDIVRCKDCKYYDGFGCENMKNERMIGMIVADDWFCADGEVRDGG